MRALLAQLAAGNVVVVTDLETFVTEHFLSVVAVTLPVGLVGGNDAIVPVDHHERLVVAVDQGLQVKWLDGLWLGAPGTHAASPTGSKPALLSDTFVSVVSFERNPN